MFVRRNCEEYLLKPSMSPTHVPTFFNLQAGLGGGRNGQRRDVHRGRLQRRLFASAELSVAEGFCAGKCARVRPNALGCARYLPAQVIFDATVRPGAGQLLRLLCNEAVFRSMDHGSVCAVRVALPPSLVLS